MRADDARRMLGNRDVQAVRISVQDQTTNHDPGHADHNNQLPRSRARGGDISVHRTRWGYDIGTLHFRHTTYRRGAHARDGDMPVQMRRPTATRVPAGLPTYRHSPRPGRSDRREQHAATQDS